MPLIKIKEKGQVTLPAKLRERHHLATGDYVEVKEEGNRIVLIPQEVAPRQEAIDAALQEAVEDERTGRVTPRFGSVKEYRAWRNTPDGKKFAQS